MSRIAAVQMASGPNLNANLLEAERLIGAAVDAGAELVVLPENFAFMGEAERDKLKVKESEGDGPVQSFLSEQAARHGIWLVGGTIPLAVDDPDKVRAACILYDDKGQAQARYDKIHLFDVSLEETGERYTESEAIEPGSRAVTADTPFGRIGLAVCYDLRFPELFRNMSREGVDLIALPAAFTAATGKAHWDPLVRARAIENLCYMVAAAQGGYHANGRETYGHSMVVDPWGIVLEQLPRGAGVAVADMDRERVNRLRRSFPALEHRRLSCNIG